MVDPAPAHSRVRFGVFELDLQTGQLRKSGVLVHLSPQPFKVLCLLAGRPGELVTREEIRDQVWGGGTFVDFEHGLNFVIKKIRDVLGDDAESPRYIETVPRRGYRLIGPIDTGVDREPAASTKPKRPYLLAIASGVAAMGIALILPFLWPGLYERAGRIGPERIDSLAVLPLDNLSGDPDQEYFADGITDQLITDLAQIPSMRVISRTSVMQYKNVRKPLDQIARELNVAAVVEGTVLRSASRVRITAQLIQAKKERHLWASSYEGELRDVLALQDHVARDIAAEIRVRLSPDVQGRISNSRSVEPEVYEDYLKGRYYWNRRTEEDVYRGIDYFRQAIAKDPHFALAYAGLADSYNVLAGYRVASPNEVVPLIKAAALKALEIDDSLAEAYTPLADVRAGYDFDLAGAEKEFRRAIELNPNYATAHQWYGEDVLAPMRRFAEALAELKRAQELDPLSQSIHMVRGYVFYLARDNDAAIEQLRATLDLNGSYAIAHMNLGRAYAQKRMFADAITEFQKADALSRGEPPYRAWLGYGYAVLGQRAEAKRILTQLKKLPKGKYMSPYDVAATLMGLGEKEEALEWLRRAFEDHSAYFNAIDVEPVFDGLHSDLRFESLVSRINHPVAR